MKKTILLAAVVATLAVASCAKKRTCTCTETQTSSYTENGTTQTQSQPAQTTTTEYKKNRKADLKTICGNSKYSSSGTETDAGGDQYSYTNTDEVTCKLK